MKLSYFFPLIIFIMSTQSCQDYLDAKPDKSLAVPSKISDFEALLNNTAIMNQRYPYSAELAADNFFMTYDTWLTRSLTTRNIYIWGDDVFNDNAANDWYTPYTVVFYANVVLEGLSALSSDELSLAPINQLKGQALFFRAFAFHQITQVFTEAYYEETASDKLGIVLSLTSDVTKKSKRASLKETYDRIIEDATASSSLLSVSSPLKTNPSKSAAFALLARVYLSMSNYGQAKDFADSALSYNNKLLDLKEIDPKKTLPFDIFNDEVIFHSSSYTTLGLTTTTAIVDTILFQSYDSNDLRKQLFFKLRSDGQGYGFYGNYGGSTSTLPFNGMASDEIYLIRAEANARLGNIEMALSDLNALLKSRFTDNFKSISANTPAEVLKIILSERRKELIYRGLRWSDLKRLNLEAGLAVTLQRNLKGQVYSLPPNDTRYALKIPNNVITISGIEQNK